MSRTCRAGSRCTGAVTYTTTHLVRSPLPPHDPSFVSRVRKKSARPLRGRIRARGGGART